MEHFLQDLDAEAEYSMTRNLRKLSISKDYLDVFCTNSNRILNAISAMGCYLKSGMVSFQKVFQMRQEIYTEILSFHYFPPIIVSVSEFPTNIHNCNLITVNKEPNSSLCTKTVDDKSLDLNEKIYSNLKILKCCHHSKFF